MIFRVISDEHFHLRFASNLVRNCWHAGTRETHHCRVDPSTRDQHLLQNEPRDQEACLKIVQSTDSAKDWLTTTAGKPPPHHLVARTDWGRKSRGNVDQKSHQFSDTSRLHQQRPIKRHCNQLRILFVLTRCQWTSLFQYSFSSLNRMRTWRIWSFWLACLASKHLGQRYGNDSKTGPCPQIHPWNVCVKILGKCSFGGSGAGQSLFDQQIHIKKSFQNSEAHSDEFLVIFLFWRIFRKCFQQGGVFGSPIHHVLGRAPPDLGVPTAHVSTEFRSGIVRWTVSACKISARLANDDKLLGRKISRHSNTVFCANKSLVVWSIHSTENIPLWQTNPNKQQRYLLSSWEETSVAVLLQFECVLWFVWRCQKLQVAMFVRGNVPFRTPVVQVLQTQWIFSQDQRIWKWFHCKAKWPLSSWRGNTAWLVALNWKCLFLAASGTKLLHSNFCSPGLRQYPLGELPCLPRSNKTLSKDAGIPIPSPADRVGLADIGGKDTERTPNFQNR